MYLKLSTHGSVGFHGPCAGVHGSPKFPGDARGPRSSAPSASGGGDATRPTAPPTEKAFPIEFRDPLTEFRAP